MYSNEDRSTDFHFYIDKFDELFQRFGYCFIAIQKKKILGTFKSWGEAIHETEKVYPRGTFIVQECSDDRNVYMVTAPTIITQGDIYADAH